ncbi:MAG: hypothetical protein J7647_07275 [Cyanobacteria bacterium SBLK]|nr:hypothetical protein [Cyanobacteria bacterium SBLK]
MKQKDAYLDIVRRCIASAKQHQSGKICFPEIIGFLAYHTLESLACAVIVHFKSTIPNNHETKLQMFMRFCKRNLQDSVNVKFIASVIIRMEKNGYRSKFLYPEFQGSDRYKAPQEQITLTEAGLLIRDVERIIDRVLGAI